MFYTKICNKLLTPIINIIFLLIIIFVNILFIISPEKYIFDEELFQQGNTRPINFYIIISLILAFIIALGLIIILTNYYKGNLSVLDRAYSRSKGKVLLINLIFSYLSIYTILFVITFINGCSQINKFTDNVELIEVTKNIFIAYIALQSIAFLIGTTFRELHISILLLMFYYYILEYGLYKYIQKSAYLIDYLVTGQGENSRYTYFVISVLLIVLYRFISSKRNIKKND